jgi:hypothetical protein
MIRFIEDDGLLCPVFICAQCGLPIQGPGLITWNWGEEDNPTFIGLHKGECDRAYGRPIPGETSTSSSPSSPTTLSTRSRKHHDHARLVG